jgi:hypothetical protein
MERWLRLGRHESLSRCKSVVTAGLLCNFITLQLPNHPLRRLHRPVSDTVELNPRIDGVF